jgi:UrcA family protein
MNIHTNNPLRIAAAVALSAALTVGARAADIPQIHVKYADLNVATTAGATILYQRIRGAADRLCGVADTRDVYRLMQAEACADHAVAEAVAAVHAPALTRVYEVKTGVDPVTRLATR